MAEDQQPPGESEDDAIRRTIAWLERTEQLTELQTTFLRSRWLGQLEWFERKAGTHQKEMNRYRVLLLAGGVALPVLVNVAATRSEGWIEAAAVVLSLVVGFAAGLEAFRRPGERWLRYRQTAEQLRAEWWLYVNLAGEPYDDHDTVAAAYPQFVLRVQALIEQDVAGFVAIVEKSRESGNAGGVPTLGDDPRP
jgi:hypothetical protein